MPTRRHLLASAVALSLPAASRAQTPPVNDVALTLIGALVFPAASNLATRAGTKHDIDAITTGFDGFTKLLQQAGHSLELPSALPSPETARQTLLQYKAATLAAMPKLSGAQYDKFVTEAVAQVSAGIERHSFVEFQNHIHAALASARASLPEARLHQDGDIRLVQSLGCWYLNWGIGYITVAIIPISAISAGAATAFGVIAWVVSTMYCG